MYSQLIGMISAQVAQTAGKWWGAYVRRSLRYGHNNLLPERAQMLRTVPEVQVTEIGLGFGKCRKHSVNVDTPRRQKEREGRAFIKYTTQHAALGLWIGTSVCNVLPVQCFSSNVLCHRYQFVPQVYKHLFLELRKHDQWTREVKYWVKKRQTNAIN